MIIIKLIIIFFLASLASLPFEIQNDLVNSIIPFNFHIQNDSVSSVRSNFHIQNDFVSSAPSNFRIQNNYFNIYIRKNAYAIDDYFNQHKIFKYYSLLGRNYIDPKKKNEINEEGVYEGLKKLYPEENSNGILILDLENKFFKDLQLYPFNTTQYNSSLEAFKKLISIVRSYRPSLKIGIYGLPFRFYYPQQSIWNSNKKLDSIFALCDLITPSLYILFPDKEKGAERNKKYMQENLQIALDYGKRLNKPIIPFIWYAVSPGNKKYGGEILEKEEVVNQIKFIQGFSYEGNKAKGIIWWEPSTKTFQNIVKVSQAKKGNSSILKDKNFIVREYTSPFVQ